MLGNRFLGHNGRFGAGRSCSGLLRLVLEEIATGIVELVHGFVFLFSFLSIIHDLESLDLFRVANGAARDYAEVSLLDGNHPDVLRGIAHVHRTEVHVRSDLFPAKYRLLTSPSGHERAGGLVSMLLDRHVLVRQLLKMAGSCLRIQFSRLPSFTTHAVLAFLSEDVADPIGILQLFTRHSRERAFVSFAMHHLVCRLE